MPALTFEGEEIRTIGDLPNVGESAPVFRGLDREFKPVRLRRWLGLTVVLNIFPSIDTRVCAQSVRMFNLRAASEKNVQVVCVSADLPFAHSRFCGTEGVRYVETMSTFGSTFGKDYGVEMTMGPFPGLLARAVLVLDPECVIRHSELVTELTDEPDYDAAMNAVRRISLQSNT